MFPILPLLFGNLFPETLNITNIIKPSAQLISILPQIYESFRNQSVSGVSMLSQHLNAIGGILGMVMCYIIPPITKTTYIIYINSIIQSFSIYTLAYYFNESIFMKKNEKCTLEKAQFIIEEIL